jgi:hypothetical protein
MSGPSDITADVEKNDSTISPIRDEQDVEVERDVLPEGGYGWIIVACQIGVNATTWGMPFFPSSPLHSALS